MPSFPGIPGFIAFAGIKFGGYCLAGLALRKLEPGVTASAVKIAASRTALGILIGPLLTIGLTYGMANLFPKTNEPDFPVYYFIYAFLYVVRILVWALVIYHFDWNQTELLKAKLWGYAALGALWSCFLDLPGFALAIITPGQIPIC